MPASEPNRAKAKAWINEWFNTSGSLNTKIPNIVRGSPGFLKVLEKTFSLKPDLIYVLSDGQYYEGSGYNKVSYDEMSKKLREWQEELPQPATINFIGVGMKPNNRKEMRSIIRSRGGDGKFRELEN